MREGPVREDWPEGVGLGGLGRMLGRKGMSWRRSARMRCAAAARECFGCALLSLNFLQHKLFSQLEGCWEDVLVSHPAF